jgi:hypothetical protein
MREESVSRIAARSASRPDPRMLRRLSTRLDMMQMDVDGFLQMMRAVFVGDEDEMAACE